MSQVCIDFGYGHSSVSHASNPSSSTTTTALKCWEDWDVICYSVMQRNGFCCCSVHSYAVSADEGPDLLCLLFFLFSLVASCLDPRKPCVLAA